MSLTHEVAACLGQLLRVDPHEVPVPSGPDPWSLWRGWLGERGLGLVPIREPREFSWPGPWLAILTTAQGNGRRSPSARPRTSSGGRRRTRPRSAPSSPGT